MVQEKERETKRAYNKAYYGANREREIARSIAYQEAKKEKKMAYDKAYRDSHKKERMAYRKAWGERNKEKCRRDKKVHSRKYHLKRKYGIDLEEYERMFKAQSGKCLICNKRERKKMLSVDHDHKTAKVRGLLCHKCNTAIGLLHDDVGMLLSAVKYLREYE